MNINDKFTEWRKSLISIKHTTIKQFKRNLKNDKGYNQILLTIRINSKSSKIEYFLLSGHGKANFISSFFNQYYNYHFLENEIYSEQKIFEAADKIISNCYSYLAFS